MVHVEGISNIEKAIQVRGNEVVNGVNCCRRLQKMQALQREHLIRHASGDHKKEFIYGFYLYYVMQGLFLFFVVVLLCHFYVFSLPVTFS